MTRRASSIVAGIVATAAEQPAFVVQYGGMDVPFFPIDDGNGYRYRCPGGCCQAWHSVDTEVDTEPGMYTGTDLRITSRPGEPVTIRGELKCGCYCTWHVEITDGVARDL